jgi:hypothetical protein
MKQNTKLKNNRSTGNWKCGKKIMKYELNWKHMNITK